MILFVGLVLIVVVAYFLAQAIAYDPGYVLVAYGGHAIELGFWWALFLSIISFLVLYFAIRLIRGILNSTSFFSRWMTRRKKKAAQAGLADGLFAYFSGDWKDAQKSLMSSAKKAESPALNYLSAAHVNLMRGDYDSAQDALKKAKKEDDGKHQLAIDICHAEILFEKDAYQSCADLCLKVLEKNSQHSVAHRLLVDSYVALDDWSSLESLMPKLYKHKIISEEELDFYSEQIVLSSMDQAADTGVEGLQSKWNSLDKDSKNNALIVRDYIERLISLSNFDEAEKMIVSAVKNDWDTYLVKLYGQLKTSDVNKQLKQVNSWMSKNDGDANLFLSAGRIALMNELWGKAKSYFENSLAIKPQPEAYAELGRLQIALGEVEKGSNNLEKSILASSYKLADLPLPKS